MKNTNLCWDDEAIFRSDLCLKSSVMMMMNEMGSGLFWVERRSAEQKWWRSRKMKPF
jgi:hypothetical protein